MNSLGSESISRRSFCNSWGAVSEFHEGMRKEKFTVFSSSPFLDSRTCCKDLKNISLKFFLGQKRTGHKHWLSENKFYFGIHDMYTVAASKKYDFNSSNWPNS